MRVNGGIMGLLLINPDEYFFIFSCDFLKFYLPGFQQGVDSAFSSFFMIGPVLAFWVELDVHLRALQSLEHLLSTVEYLYRSS